MKTSFNKPVFRELKILFFPVLAGFFLSLIPGMSKGLDIGADYLLEIASDLDTPATNRTNVFGLGQLSAQQVQVSASGTSTIRASAFWLIGESLNSVGDLNGLSNIAGLEALRLAHLWFQYETKQTRFKIGRFDIDDDFMAFESGADLINSSFGAFANVTANMPVPTYPVPGLAAQLSYRWNSETYIDVAIMDGDAGLESQHDNFGFDLGSSGVGGVFILTQFNHLSSKWLRGNKILLGLALHSGAFNTFDQQQDDGNALIYGGIERQLLTSNRRELHLAIRLAASPFEDRNSVTYQADITATYRGAFEISAGLISAGFVYLKLSDEFSATQSAESSEWTAEINYRYDFTKRWFASSSLQYIDGGTVVSEAKLVGLLRLGWSY